MHSLKGILAAYAVLRAHRRCEVAGQRNASEDHFFSAVFIVKQAIISKHKPPPFPQPHPRTVLLVQPAPHHHRNIGVPPNGLVPLPKTVDFIAGLDDLGAGFGLHGGRGPSRGRFADHAGRSLVSLLLRHMWIWLFLKNKVTVFWRKLPTHRMPERCGLLVMVDEVAGALLREALLPAAGQV